MFWNRFYHLCEMNDTKPNPVAKEIGISSGVITKWKNEGTMPNADTLLKLAERFDCSTDYLLGLTEEIKYNQADSRLSDDEKELIGYFRSLGKIGRRHVLTFAENEVSAEAEKGAGAVIA